jgi:cytochrome oxidase Cu insertion factor (SCO1/SenC/PrrC family)
VRGLGFGWEICPSVKPVTDVTMAQTAALRYKWWVMKINDKAPSFTLPDENGTETSLAQFKGKPMVLFFYPKADTPG